MKGLSRRATLKGMGTAIALPLLEAMTRPARAQSSSPNSSGAPRFLAFFVPCGINMATFTPADEGPGFGLSDMLSPLEKVRDRLSVLSGVLATAAFDQGDGPGDHARGTSTFLTATHPNKSEVRVQSAISVDQVMAAAWRGQTPLSSLELGCEPGGAAGSCDVGYSCAYVHHIAWASPTTPLPKETNPRAVFDRLFQSSDAALSPQAREDKRRRRRSVLDFVRDDGLRVAFELMGYWSRRAVWSRIEAVEDGLVEPALFAVSERLRVSKEAMPKEAPSALYVFKGTLRPKAILEHLERLAERCDARRPSSIATESPKAKRRPRKAR